MIHHFHIQNFKSIIDITVDLSPVTVLVGKSGTGKSNFVHALRFLRDVLSSQEQYSNHIQQNWAAIRPAIASDDPTRFEVEFTIADVEPRYKYALSMKNSPFGVVIEEQLHFGGKKLFHQEDLTEVGNRRQPQWVLEPDLLQHLNPGPIALGRIPSISEVVNAYTALSVGVGCYSFSDKVLCKTIEPDSNQREWTSGLDDEANNFLIALRQIVSDPQTLKTRNSMVSALKCLNPSVSSVELNDIWQPRHVVVGHKFNGKTLSLFLSQESDGFRRFYAHLLALYQKPPKQTLIFEHPEDGIHPGALSLLAEEFKAAPDDGRGQVILTTHSPKLLDYFDVEQIRVVELDGYETRIGMLASEQREAIRERLLDAGELLTVDPARIQQEAKGA